MEAVGEVGGILGFFKVIVGIAEDQFGQASALVKQMLLAVEIGLVAFGQQVVVADVQRLFQPAGKGVGLLLLNPLGQVSLGGDQIGGTAVIGRRGRLDPTPQA